MPLHLMIEWETGEITEEPLSCIAVTCVVYAKQHDLLHLEGWRQFRSVAKNQKKLTGDSNQNIIRQERK